MSAISGLQGLTRYRCASATCPGLPGVAGPWEGPPPADGLGRPTSPRDATTGRRRDLAPHERGTFAQRPWCPVCGETAVLVPEPEPLSGDLLGPAEPTDELPPVPPEDPVARLRRDWEAREADRDRREAERESRVQREIDSLRPAPPAVGVPVPQGPQPVPVVHRDLKPANRRFPWRAALAAATIATGIVVGVAGAGLGPAWLGPVAVAVRAALPLVEQVVVEDTGAVERAPTGPTIEVPGDIRIEGPAPGVVPE